MATEAATDTSTDTSQAAGDETVLNAGETTEASGGGEQDQTTDGQDAGAGDEGELEITLPEGVEADEKMLDGFKSVAKEAGLDSENASKLAVFYASQQKEAAETQTAAWQKQRQDWVGELKEDPDFGGKAFKENAAAAVRAVREYGEDGMGKALQDAGLDNFPPLVRMLAKIGRAMGEDTTSTEKAKAGSNVAKSRDEALTDLYNHSGPAGT